jgi:glycosyltransferase involved in cell wall biosynthesis
MIPFSIVIVCRNEADIIASTLKTLDGVTDDIILYDNGSTDNTVNIIRQFNVRLQQGNWEGFGKTKNRANSLAKNDWILSLDADESIDDELKSSLKNLHGPDEKTVFNIDFKNFMGQQHIRYGEWGRDQHIRFFNRKNVKWDEAHVHEQLIFPPGVIIKKLKGNILHRTMKDLRDYSEKMVKYAMLGATKYFEQGKKAGWFRLRLAPGFSFFRSYILLLGFLDGHAGYVNARMTAWYTFMKYARLKELWMEKRNSG